MMSLSISAIQPVLYELNPLKGGFYNEPIVWCIFDAFFAESLNKLFNKQLSVIWDSLMLMRLSSSSNFIPNRIQTMKDRIHE